MITGNEDISIGGEDVPKARSLNVTSKSLRFAHKFTGGETALSLGSLIMPSEISTWSNPSPSEIAAANLLSTSANLIIKSSTGAELFEGVDFVVSSNSGLAFINGYSPQPGEIIIGRFNLPVSSILVSDAKEYRKTVAVTAGQTIVNVGFEYKVNQNPTQQIGDVRVNSNGLSKLLRNVGNATAAPLADGNYEEYDPTGSGYSTAIRLNNPIVSDGFMIFEGGLALASADVKIFGALDRLGAIVTKLAEDSSYGFHGDNDLTRYLTASASEVERATFGDLLLSVLNRLNNVVYDQFHTVEYSGGILTGTRVRPQTLLNQQGSGAFNLANVVSNGEFGIVKSGWYSFHGKTQMTALGTMSITRDNSSALNGNAGSVLESVVPVTAQEFGLNWTGYLAAGQIVSFNANTGLATSDNRHIFTASFLGTKAPITI